VNEPDQEQIDLKNAKLRLGCVGFTALSASRASLAPINPQVLISFQTPIKNLHDLHPDALEPLSHTVVAWLRVGAGAMIRTLRRKEYKLDGVLSGRP
jgi:hypothetical protein